MWKWCLGFGILYVPIFAMAADVPKDDDAAVAARRIEEIAAVESKLNEYESDWRCTKLDKRILNWCLQARFFQPTTRVYLDSSDDSGKVDVFNNGSLNVNLDFISVYLPWRIGRRSFYDPWTWGPIVGAGIGAPAQDSKDGAVKATNAPVILFSLGLLLEYTPSPDGPSFGFEIGRAVGISSDETYGERNKDYAKYVGLKINVPLKKSD